jgi:disulfide bond formation protein DsbB
MGSNVTPVIQCDVVTWKLFGLSLAGYNGIISLGTALLGALLLAGNRR